MTNTNTHKRFNGTCKACKRTFSVLARRTNESADLPVSIACAGVYIGYSAGVLEDADGFKRLAHEGGIAHMCACGRTLVLKPVIGRFVADHKCDARCVQAKGHSCECACGGKNHGSGYGA